jgi:two-component system sensor histidine kinase KdpD
MKQARWIGYLYAAGAALCCTVLGLAMAPRFDIVNIAMVYLLAVVLVALRFTRGPAVLSAILCVAAFDFVFVPPRGAFAVEDVQYLLTFAIMVAVALVISGLIEARQRQEAAQARLTLEAETERLRSTLLASVSHDLRTPLTVMTGAASSLVEEKAKLGEAERQALARSIYEQARAMSEQVAKLLQMTRIETGAIEVERDWASVPELAGSVLARLSEQLAQHRLLIDLPADLPLVRVDASLIDQALANLLENAARHTASGTVVRLRARVQDGELVISVEDFGPGIDERDFERVFAKFHRGANEIGGGVGLGLAITRAIVRLHGGRTWAERIPGGGTAFRLTLPLEPAPAPPAETVAPP